MDWTAVVPVYWERPDHGSDYYRAEIESGGDLSLD